MDALAVYASSGSSSSSEEGEQSQSQTLKSHVEIQRCSDSDNKEASSRDVGDAKQREAPEECTTAPYSTQNRACPLPQDLPRELALELSRNGTSNVRFIDVDARASAAARNLVTDADRAAATSGAVLRQRMQGTTVSRAQRRTHHISSLAASAVANAAAQNALHGAVQKRSRRGKH